MDQSILAIRKNFQNQENDDPYEQNEISKDTPNGENKNRKLEGFKAEYSKMPMCAEKLILKLIFDYGKHDLNDGLVNCPNEMLADLETRLRNENLLSKKVRDFLNKLKDPTVTKTLILENMLEEIRDVDIYRLKSLTSRNKEAIEVIRNKDVYLFIGLTGHGKSTTIHYLAGSEFEEYRVNGEVARFATGRPHYVPTPRIKGLERVTTSPYPESDTQNIIPVVLNLPDGQEVILCDAPGFEDTNGVEIDIANSIAIENAISACKEVKPIVVISKNMGEKMIGLQNLAKMLSRMVYNVSENISRLTYVFTNYTREEAKIITTSINHLTKTESFKNSTDEGYKMLIYSLESKTQSDPIIIDLNDPSKKDDVIKKTIDRILIKNPKQFFKLSFGVKSQKALSDQIDKHTTAIKNALKRGDKKLFDYKMGELMYLRELFDGMEMFEKKFKDIISMFTEYFNSKEFKIWSEDHKLTNQDLDSFCSALKEYQDMDMFKKMLFEDDDSLESLKLRFTEYVDKMVVINESVSSKTKVSNLHILNSFLVNSDFFKELSNHIKTKYDETRKSLLGILEEKVKICNDVIKHNPPESIGKKILDLHFFSENYGEFLVGDDRAQYNIVINALKYAVTEKLEVSIVLIRNIDQEAFQTIDSNLKYMSYLLYDLRSYDFFKSQDQDLINSINKSHKNLLDEVVSVFKTFKSELEGEVPDLEPKFKQLMLLKKNNEISQETDRLFRDICSIIGNKLLNAQNNITRQFNLSLDGIFEFMNIEKLISSIQSLQKLKWFDELDKKPCEEGINEIESKFLKNIEYIRDDILENIDLSEYAQQLPDNDEKLQKAFRLKERLCAYRELGKVFPNLPYQIDELVKILEKKLIDELEKINNQFEIEDMENQRTDFKKAEAAFNFLNKTAVYQDRSSNQLKDAHRKAKTKLEQHLNHRYESVEGKLEENFQVLESNLDENSMDQSAKEIYKQMKQIKDIAGRISVLDRFGFKGLYNTYKTKLLDIFPDVKQSMEQAMIRSENEPNLLQRELRKVRCLFVLNEFLGRETNDPNFKNLYHEYNRSSVAQAKRVFDESTNLLNNRSFEQLAQNMNFFEESKDENACFYFKTLKLKINVWLRNALENLTSLSSMCHDLEPNDLNNIKNLLSAITQAEIHLNKFIQDELLTKAKNEKINFNTKISKIVNDYLERLEKLQKMFDVDQFRSKLKNALDQKKLLKELCDGNQEIIKKLEDWNINQNEAFRLEIVDRFQNLDVDKYSNSPPNVILNKLISLPSECSVLRLLVIEKYKNELEEASMAEDFKNNEHFKKCERNKIYLSGDLRDEIDRMVSEYTNNNLRERNELETKLNQMLGDNKLNKISELLKKEEENSNKKNFCQIKRFVKKSYNLTKKELNEAFNDCNLKVISNKIDQIVCFKHFFSMLLSDNEMEEAAKSFFLKRVLEAIDPKLSTPDKNSNLVKTYELLVKLSTLKIAGLEEIRMQVNKQVFEKMISCNNEFNAGLKEEDFERVKNAMSSAQPIDSIWSRPEQVNELMGYDQMKKHLKKMFDSARKCVEGDGLVTLPNDSNLLEKDYNDYFTRLEKQHKFLENFNIHFKDVFQREELGIKQDFNRALDSKMNTSLGKADQILEKILDENTSKANIKDFNMMFFKLRSYENVMRRRVADHHKPVLEYFLDKVIDKIQIISQQPVVGDIQKAADCFVRIKKLSTSLIPFKAKIDEELECVMQKHIKCIGFKNFGLLAVKLFNSNEGRMIIHEHRCFEGYQWSIFNEKTIRQDISYVLDEIRGENVEKDVLKEIYTDFHKLYEKLILEHLCDNNLEEQLNDLALKTTNLSENIFVRDLNSLLCWDETVRAKIPNLLAHMFALWTIMNSRGYFETNEYDTRSYLFKPHSAQVVSVFRMLGIGYTNKSKKLENNLVQLGTGEGKSITLGITCALLALLGFDVECVCYSQYLSDRDFKAIKPLFNILRVEQFIHYGTFKQICEHFINKCGDVRENVEKFLKQGKISMSSKVSTRDNRPQILLIDEVDVFFSEDFYGNSYNPVLIFKSSAIEALVREIWKRRLNITNDKVKNMDLYRKCIVEFSGWKRSLLDHFIDQMISYLGSYKYHQYVVKDDKIGYTSQDAIAFNHFNGYNTMFAYFKENECKMISQESLKENIGMNINVGIYSFAEIPKSFDAIIGLSGTLESFTDSQKMVIKDEYGIKLKTITPSVYGQKKLVFDKSDKKDVVIEKKESYHKELVQHIRYRQSKYGPSCKRPILIFFEDKEKLMELYKSKEYKEFINDTAYLIEEASAEEKTHIVMNATTEGKKLLATRIFGRGTDFVVYDTKVLSNGGVHVIQTFLSEELSEEIQIKGRTARQGDEGSYSMFLLDSSLAKFNITAESLAENKSRLYDHLNEKRNEYFSNKYSKSIKNVQTVKQRHSESMQFLKALNEQNQEVVKKFILESNKY